MLGVWESLNNINPRCGVEVPNGITMDRVTRRRVYIQDDMYYKFAKIEIEFVGTLRTISQDLTCGENAFKALQTALAQYFVTYPVDPST